MWYLILVLSTTSAVQVEKPYPDRTVCRRVGDTAVRTYADDFDRTIRYLCVEAP